MKNKYLTNWAKEIDRFLYITPQFILSENIYDVYPISIDDIVIPLNLTDYLIAILKDNEYDLILKCNAYRNLSIEHGNKEDFERVTGIVLDFNKNYPELELVGIVTQLEFNTSFHSAVIIEFANFSIDYDFYGSCFSILQNSTAKLGRQKVISKFNTVFFLVQKDDDITERYWFDNPRIKKIPLPKPDNEIRKLVISSISKNTFNFEKTDPSKIEKSINSFIDLTNDMYIQEIISIVNLSRRDKIPFSKIDEAIKRYKFGIIENPWSKLDFNKISEAGTIIKKRVKGQEQAISKTVDIVKRGYYNLSGAQNSRNSQKPKGVMFFAGPTGVGKTELAKTITQLLFGSEDNYIRFDMSEFSQEHTYQRLIGSPPGYLGSNQGGELTNAIKQKPFSVILFDEIEKSHPKIFDIFLQILDDGRLTSAQGDTVYFSECLIIFTSNLGIYETDSNGMKRENVNSKMPFEDINKIIKSSIENYFKYTLNRPEILNRIGENIVVFDFIRPENSKEIFVKMIKNVIFKISESHNIKIDLSQNLVYKLSDLCCKDLSMGGRGIGNKIELFFINPLCRCLFENEVKNSAFIKIEDLTIEKNKCELILKK